ncbi:MAG: hypothetical protein ACKVT2_12750 [Saprospiraceae bacterium]
MANILDFIAKQTNGTPYKSYKYCVDTEYSLPAVVYDETSFSFTPKRLGESDTTITGTKSMTKKMAAMQGKQPLFRYFLDGSRRVYKIDDVQYGRRLFPVVAGQIGVACCERVSKSEFRNAIIERPFVLALPGSEANPEGKNTDLFLNKLKDQVNDLERLKRFGVQISKILSYSSIKGDDDFTDRGIAMIQDEMIEREKKIVAELATRNLLGPERYLMKDGSLEYKEMQKGDYRQLSKIKNNYRWVVGVSKSFNPELMRDTKGKSNAPIIANLPFASRTPAFTHQTDIVGNNVHFCVWYVRVRERRYTESPFAGVLKIEKLLVSEEEKENGLDSSEIDTITANIINERNPVCYGKDQRWANHLYPIYLTEIFIKSRYLSDLYFLNLFQ